MTNACQRSADEQLSYAVYVRTQHSTLLDFREHRSAEQATEQNNPYSYVKLSLLQFVE